jgi:mannose-1-phosphate guanylyltransferase/mannose-6-phosphate isomerase
VSDTWTLPITPVILCGGGGTRLWPLSRTHYPKQFLQLVNDRSLLQNTLLRLSGLPNRGKTIAVTNECHRFLLAEQLLEIGEEADILLEPAARNTAPAVAAAAHWAIKNGGSILLVLPSDHVLADVTAFHQAIAAALPHAAAGQMVTFGITPTQPETGYGYIQRSEVLTGGFRIKRFVEKPDRSTAEALLAAGNTYWNSGMFLFRAETYLVALERCNSAMAGAARQSVERACADLDFIRLDKASFSASPADSIDYAVMEHHPDGVVIPLDAGWNDIGAWDALCRSASADFSGNTCNGDVIAHDCTNSLVHAESRLVAAIGLTDMVVIETADAVLVAPKARAQDVKHIVDRLKLDGRAESEFHTRVHRPWGSYEGVAQGDRHQVKRIVVKPGRSLSLQLHHHRAEHWIVVRGTAKVTRDEETFLLSENESTYIPPGTRHRLENPGKFDLEIIEIQSGSYLGEDDIVRFDDHYGRHA